MKNKNTPVLRLSSPSRAQGGFTLVELIFGVLILGILSVALSASFKGILGARERAYRDEQTAINLKIAQALMQQAEFVAAPGIPGKLIAPCHRTLSKVFFSIYNPSFCSGTSVLADFLVQQGVALERVNDDGSSAKNLRVYQRVANIAQDANLFYRGGPTVYLNYDIGVVYTTNCSATASCNTTSASSSVPPASTGESGAGAVALTDANRSTWTPGTRDVGVAYLSTLPLQKKLLQSTEARLETLRSAFQAFYAAKQAAAPASTANHYPTPTNAAQQSPGQDPSLNQGCRDGWYLLDSAAIDLLSQVGISESSYGRTAWGGGIEYCRDYDPAGTSGANVAPHYAALRIHRTVGGGLGPEDTRSGASPGTNLVVSF